MECRGRHGCSCPYGRTRRLEPKGHRRVPRERWQGARSRGSRCSCSPTPGRGPARDVNLSPLHRRRPVRDRGVEGRRADQPRLVPQPAREPVRDGGDGKRPSTSRPRSRSGRARAPVGDDHREEPVLRRVRALDPPDDPGDDPAPDRGLASGQLVEPAAHQSCEVGGVRRPVRLGDDGGSFPVEAHDVPSGSEASRRAPSERRSTASRRAGRWRSPCPASRRARPAPRRSARCARGSRSRRGASRAVRPPTRDVPADRRHEVRQVVPEPVQDVPKLFDLFRAVRLGERELRPARIPFSSRSVRNGPVSSRSSSLSRAKKLPVGPVGQDEEGDRVQGEALQEQRLAEPFDDRRSIGEYLLVGVVPRDQAEIEVRYSSASPWRPIR